jgi:nitrogen regulatory protein PII-like uncharacterized protein
MANKKLDIANPFGDSPDINDINDVDQAVFGKVDIGKQSKRDRIRNIEIATIRPDRMQPRRVVPSVIRANRDDNPYQMITNWLKLIAQERQERFDRATVAGLLTDHDRPDNEFPWQMYLLEGVTERGWDEGSDRMPDVARDVILDTGPLETSFVKVINLAESIHRDGLSNPISVAKAEGTNYVIETGERRWLAYHLLDMFLEDHDYSKIPARVVDEVSIWRQAAENNARDNLNAVSRARQLAILLMDLYGVDNFEGLDNFAHEQDFYAQVADGTAYPVPRGKGEQVINAMGLKNTVQIRQYRGILRLEHRQWELADDTDMTERQIRDLEKDVTVTAVTPQKPKVDRFAKVIDNLDRELSENSWRKLEPEERRERYEALTRLLDRLDAWGLD